MTTNAARTSYFALSDGMSIYHDKNLYCGFILNVYITNVSQNCVNCFLEVFRRSHVWHARRTSTGCVAKTTFFIYMQ